jgi:phage-related protein
VKNLEYFFICEADAVDAVVDALADAVDVVADAIDAVVDPLVFFESRINDAVDFFIEGNNIIYILVANHNQHIIHIYIDFFLENHTECIIYIYSFL